MFKVDIMSLKFFPGLMKPILTITNCLRSHCFMAFSHLHNRYFKLKS
jgi:hypothetical protein